MGMSREEAIKGWIIPALKNTWNEKKNTEILKALEQQPKTEPNRCNQCKYYEGVHNVQGHAPCSLLKCGGVLWDWHCSNYEPIGAESEPQESKESDAENLCDSCKTKGCIFQSGIVRSHCDFYKAEREDEKCHIV